MERKKQHPTVQELDLRVYESKYDGKCTLCRDSYFPGNDIVRLPPDLLKMTNDLGMSTKVFKYAHVDCLPVLLPESYIPMIREAAEHLLELTDPEWPKDFQGFNASDASPVAKWLDLGCPRIAAHEIARRLIKYLDTQLGGQETERGKAIIKAGSAKSVVELWNGNGGAKPEWYNRPELTEAVPCEAIPGAVVRERKITGEIFIENGKDMLKVHLDPPWENKEHLAVKDAIKAAGARWDKGDKCWRLGPSIIAEQWQAFCGQTVAVTTEAAKRIDAALDRRALSQAGSVEQAGVANGIKEKLAKVLAKVLPDGLSLWPFQEAGVAFAMAANGRALIGDEMGLGKTIQAIAYCAVHPEQRPILCVVPAIVSTNWQDEFQKWLPSEKVFRVRNGKDEIPTDASVIIITYGLATRRVADLKKLKPQVLVIDESHYLKNYKAKRTQAVLELVKECEPPSVLALSGTPVVNRPVEFYTTLRMLRPNDFRSWRYYTGRYCNGHQTRWGYDCSGASNTKELSSKLRDLMVRRNKADVLTELPAKTRITVDVEMGRAEWKEYHDAVQAAYDTNDAGAHLAAISAGRRVIGRAKVKPAVEWISEYHNQGLPVVVFAHHEDVLSALQAACEKKGIRVGVIAGSTSHEARGGLVRAFQDGSLDAIIISALAGGVGITLTRSSNVLFVERQWTPGAEEQAEDRTHRIGQHDPVTVRYLLVKGTVDVDMNALIEAKRGVLHDILDGHEVSTEKLDIRKELVALWKQRMKDGDQTHLGK